MKYFLHNLICIKTSIKIADFFKIEFSNKTIDFKIFKSRNFFLRIKKKKGYSLAIHTN